MEYNFEYDFNEVIDRTGTNSVKHDCHKKMGKPEDAIPLWVADMDFRIPREVTEALIESAKHSIFGYTIASAEYTQAVQNWFARYYGYETKAEWIVQAPGVVFALAMAVQAFTQEGEKIMIQRPVYYPFERVITDNNRKMVDNSLVIKNSRYYIDFDDFERKIVENNVKMFILCSPHNPVSRVWTKEELYQMGKICNDHNCLIISDEIHCDITYEGYNHHVFSTVDSSFLENSVICTAPSKTFNLAGLQASNIFIANKQLRHRFRKMMEKAGYGELNTMGLAAAKAAYEHGHNWLKELCVYLKGNLEFMKGFFAEDVYGNISENVYGNISENVYGDISKNVYGNIHERADRPQIKIIEPEGSYLIWLDFRSFGMGQQKLDETLLNQAKVWLSSGTTFGPQGEGFQRINIACPRKTLEEALNRITKVLGSKV